MTQAAATSPESPRRKPCFANRPRSMLGVRIAFTAVVMAVVVWLLLSGKPLGGLLIVPLVAIWIRRAAESGRLTRFTQRFVKPS
jgi:Flp pilus assembly protein TadB